MDIRFLAVFVLSLVRSEMSSKVFHRFNGKCSLFSQSINLGTISTDTVFSQKNACALFYRFAFLKRHIVFGQIERGENAIFNSVGGLTNNIRQRSCARSFYQGWLHHQ